MTIRVGVVGLGRGVSFALGAGTSVGMELVAICDTWEERLLQIGAKLGVSTYTSYDRFLEHDMDAVVLANYFHEHAPLAIKALRAGLHVMSETAACKTLAEGVALCREVERSGKVYMLAENYPFMAFNQHMRHLYRQGEIGAFRYGEGEYVHPFSAEQFNTLAPGEGHWRNWVPMIYYCTHALAPVLYITDSEPAWVNGFAYPYDTADPEMTRTARRADPIGLIVVRTHDGAIIKALQGALRGHSVWVRVHGTKGEMENLRNDPGVLWIRHEPWDGGETRLVDAEFPEYAGQAAEAGHGGGDFFTNLHFARAIRTGRPPWLDVYRGVAISVCGALAHRSALENGAALPVPDFRDEAARKLVEDDHWSPFPEDAGPGQPPPSIAGRIEPSEEGLAYARQVWERGNNLYQDSIDSMLSRGDTGA